MIRHHYIGGMPVVDADHPIMLQITKRDIAGSRVKDPKNCVVARACRRALNVKEAKVHLSRVYLRTDDTHWVRYLTGRTLRGEIIAFDRGGSFDGGDYWLSAPDPSTRLDARKRKKHSAKDGSRPGRNAKRQLHTVKNVRARAP